MPKWNTRMYLLALTEILVSIIAYSLGICVLIWMLNWNHLFLAHCSGIQCIEFVFCLINGWNSKAAWLALKIVLRDVCFYITSLLTWRIISGHGESMTFIFQSILSMSHGLPLVFRAEPLYPRISWCWDLFISNLEFILKCTYKSL